MLKDELITYKVCGLNFKKFLNLLKKENVEIVNLSRKDYSNFVITIKKKNEKSFLSLTKKLHYEIDICYKSPILKTVSFFKTNVALFICIFFLFSCLVFSCNFIFKIEVLGCETVNLNQVIKILEKENIKPYKPKSYYNTNEIAIKIYNNLENISLVSAFIQGSTLIINVNEKISNGKESNSYEPILAPYDCIIKNIELKSGTAAVQNGQTLKKGDVIVYPYINYKDGTQLNVSASAKIEAYVEVSNSVNYLEHHLENVRSGRKYVVESFSIFNINYKRKEQKNSFNNYETEQSKSCIFKNLFIPIIKTKTVYYELVEQEVYKPIDSVLQNIIEQNKNILYTNIVDFSNESLEYYTTVNKQEYVFVITTYLKAVIKF